MYFRDGSLIYAVLEGHPNTLADLMVKAGKLTQNQANAIQASGRVRDDKQLGLLLINAGQADKDEVLQAIRQNMLDIVQAVFQWADGSFMFDQKVSPPPGRISIPVSLEKVILEGSRQREEQTDLQTELPSLDVVLRFTDGPGSNLRDINLSVEEWKVISFINPRNTIATIARFNQMSEFKVRKIVAKLLRDELVEIVGGTTTPSTPATAPTPTPKPATSVTDRPGVVAPASSQTAQPTYEQPEVEKGIIRRLIERIRGL